MNSEMLPVMESFYTIQGEGKFQGSAAYFIRLGGCDVECHWCDVKESWPIDAHPKYAIQDLVAEVPQQCPIVIITGGEPLMHSLDQLTNHLKDSGFRTHIETSGAHPVSGSWDWFCLSPKKFKAPNQESYELADELKVIIYNKHDFEFAIDESSKVNENCRQGWLYC
jgi:7-carboxy-7-deazaguanine synthase